MTFAFPTLFWFGLPLVAVPAIIHFLNLRRQQRIEWAAMDFLLESQQRSKTWINLKELILLLLRTAAVALLVMLVSKPSLQSGWLNQWLGEPVHHLVLVDDSYSATDRFGDLSAWQQARAAVQTIVRRVADESQANRVTVQRFSEAVGDGQSVEPSIFRVALAPDARDDVLARLDGWQATAGDAPLVDALRVADQFVGQWTQENVVVHVVADYRSRDLVPEEDTYALLAGIRDKVDHLHVVGSVRSQQENLSLSALSIASGTLATGVEVWAEVAVVNHGTTTAGNVVVEIEQDGQPLPAVELGAIPPGETIRQRFRCRFADPGSHSLVAMIGDDAVAVDNRRSLACDVPEQVRLLLVDGSPSEWESYFVATALGPGGATNTGWSTETVAPDRFSNVEDLAPFAAVALLDVEKLSEESLARLEEFVASGGGLFIVLGESIDRTWYRERLFADGAGLLPAPPKLPTQWVPPDDDSVDDVQVADHPAFRVFASQRNSFLPLLAIDFYYSVESDWQRTGDGTSVIAKLANGAPLVIEKRFGEGRVIAQMTRIANTPGTLGVWSNWSLNPAFPVLANETFGWLAVGKRPPRDCDVGGVLSVSLDREQFDGTARLIGVSDGIAVDTTLAASDAGESLTIQSPPLDDPGLYELRLGRTAGGQQSQLWSVNPNPAEGDLKLAQASTLKQKLAASSFSFEWADALIGAGAGSAGTSLVESILIAMLIVLALEQVFAYMCSYHD